MTTKDISLRQGFTIVELLIVIVVIAILAAITVVAYTGIQRQAQTAQLQSFLNSSAKAVATYKIKSTSDQFPASLSDVGVASDASIQPSYLYDNATQQYCISGKHSNGTEMYITSEGTITAGSCLDFGLTGHWLFNGNANDSSVHALNGTVTGATLTTGKNGQPNSAYSFSNGSYINIGTSNLYGTPVVSLSAWVNRTDNLTEMKTVFSASTNLTKFGFNASKPLLAIPSNSIMPTGSVTTGWTHIVYIVDRQNMVARFYKNGVQMGTTTTLDSSWSVYNTTSQAYIGTTTEAPLYSPGAASFNGTLDDVRLYSRALSNQEVQQLYDLGAQ